MADLFEKKKWLLHFCYNVLLNRYLLKIYLLQNCLITDFPYFCPIYFKENEE